MRVKGKKLSGNAYFSMVIMAVMLAIIVSALMMEYFASKLLPILFGSTGFILAGVGFYHEVFYTARPENDAKVEKAHGEEAGGGWGGYLMHFGWLVAFFLAIYLVGFVVAIPLFIIFYMQWLGTKWLTALIYAVVVAALVYFLFERMLDVELYRGMFFKFLG